MKTETSSQIDINMKNKTSHSPWAIARRKFMKNKVAMISFVILMIIITLALLAPIIATSDITKINVLEASQPPSADHWLGTDKGGRDVFTLVLHGGRTSLMVGFMCTVFIMLIGTTLGLLAGFYGGWLDTFIMRIVDFVLILPFYVFVIALNGILVKNSVVGGVWLLIIVISALSWGGATRMVRSKVLAEKENEYIMAAKSIGNSSFKIMFKHLLPNVISIVIVQATLLFAGMIVAEAGLTFLGFGVPQSEPSWGNMLSSARQSDILQNKVWMWIPPAVLISVTILCINFIGEGLKDAFNPKSSK